MRPTLVTVQMCINHGQSIHAAQNWFMVSRRPVTQQPLFHVCWDGHATDIRRRVAPWCLLDAYVQ